MINNILQPTGDQMRAFRDRASGKPIYMLNLLKFKDKAVYEDGRETNLTGEEAYRRYGEGFRKVMEPKGARVIYSGQIKGWLINKSKGAWDAVAVISYPSTQVMLDMMRDPEYQAVHQHRAAGLDGQLLIECGEGFSF